MIFLILGIVIFLFGLSLYLYKVVLEDIFNFVIETNDDVEQIKNSVNKNNAP